MKPSSRNLRLAFTLIEAMLASVILAMAITAIVMPFTTAVVSEADDARRTLAVNLAQEMMEEVLSKPFHDPAGVMTPGPETGEVRATFDNIDDYNNYSESAGQIKSFDGQVITGSAAVNLSRKVTTTYVYVSGQSTSNPATFIRITVSVSYGGQTIVSLSRLVFADASK